MPKYAIFFGLAAASLLPGCGSPSEDAASTSQSQAEAKAVELPADFPSDIALPDDTRLVLVSRPLPGDVFIEGRSRQEAKAIVEGFATRLADAGYVLTDRSKTVDPLELYFEGKGVESGNIRVRDDGTERDFMLTYTEAAR
ncbi:hypothetical protein [Sphingosinithalassobacter portus]|uniref:hypothetical protein n=1 Tax=Stakelama portus TaxID=2676234 RepID=UPI000D6DE0E7|nr:hypothetical protein [Sphingosinithalassobacter portus]